MQEQEIIPHLFRTEFSKISSVLARAFGIDHLETAEDIASETFLAALETWPYRGIPPNPSAWLYTVAKNKARNYLNRHQLFSQKIKPALVSAANQSVEIDLSEENIADSQLQMLFTLCHPAISPESQIGLSLRILCGFGIDEIATAFLASKDTIVKRLQRAKEKLREESIRIEMPSAAAMEKRLDAVLATLYLLFSEGYYSEDSEDTIRQELCTEAMRLALLLINNKHTNQPRVNALYALMCFQASRFPARKNNQGDMILYEEQDESLWDQELVAKGAYYLNLASIGTSYSKYHLEASIAWWYTQKEDSPEKWEQVLHLYELLLQLEHSPIAAMNRVYAISKLRGKLAAIEEAQSINLPPNHFYFTLMGELYSTINDSKAVDYFQKAIALAKTASDRKIIECKMNRVRLPLSNGSGT